MRSIPVRLDDGETVPLQLHRNLTVVGAGPGLRRAILEALPAETVVLAAGDVPAADREDRLQAMRAAEAERAEAGERFATHQADAERAATRRSEVEREVAARRQRLNAAAEHARGGRDALDRAIAAQARAQLVHERALATAAECEARAVETAALRRGLEAWRSAALQRRALGPDDANALDALLDRCITLGAGAGSVEAMRRWVTAVRNGTAKCVDEASVLLVRHRDLERRAKATPPPHEDAVVRVESDAIARSGVLLRQLEETLAAGDLSDDARRAIDAAHERATAGGRRDARDAGRAAVEETELLTRYGFDSFLEYSIAISTGALAQHARRKIDVVRAELEVRRAALDAARNAAEARVEAIRTEQTALERDVVAFLGHEPTGELLTGVLRRYVLIPGELDDLVTEVEASEHRAHADSDRTRLAVADSARMGHDATDAVASARAALEAAEIDEADAASAVEAAQDDLEEAEAAARECDATLAVAADALAACEVRVRELSSPTLGPAEVGEQLAALRARLDAAGTQSDVPLALDDAWAQLGTPNVITLLDHLADRAVRARIVYITSDEAVLAWAQRLRRWRGACVDVHDGHGGPRPRSWLRRRGMARTS